MISPLPRRSLRSAGWTLGIVVAGLLLPVLALAQSPRYDFRPGEVLIKFAPTTSAASADSILKSLGAVPVAEFSSIGAVHERISRMSVEQAVAAFRGDRRVQYIEPNYIVHAYLTPNDPYLPQMWGLHNTGQNGGTPGADIHALEAWDVSTGSASVLVAIIDSGVDYTHPDLAANIFVNSAEIAGNGIDDDGNGFIDDVHGWDFVNHDNDPMDDLGHGTHVSGTIGALGNNGLGVVGVTWNVRLLPVKFLDANGSGSLSDAVLAVEYATRMGARVMSNSWGGGPYSQTLYDAIRAAGDAGDLFVAAAGNSGSNNDFSPAYPASYDLPNIISVAASDPFDHLAGFSNYGLTTVDLAAPGTDILSTFPAGGYQYLSGTSMATPHVSGAVALILSRFPLIDPASAKNLLLASVDHLPALSGLVASGGRLNAFQPLLVADNVSPDPIMDVAVVHADGQWVDLQWTATGDDGAVGRAARYDLRYSTAPITPQNFGTATAVLGTPDPLPSGTPQTVRVNGLSFGTPYYFAVEARDELGNSSSLSNVVTATTLGPPEATIASASLNADLLTGQTALRTLTITNSGQSALSFLVAEQPRTVTAASASRVIIPAGVLVPSRAGSIPETDEARWYHEGHVPMHTSAAVRTRAITPSQVVGGLRVLLLTSGGLVTNMRDLLAGYPDFAQVDIMDARYAVPTLAQLQGYQAVIVSNGTAFGDPFSIGNVLADYVDGGGGLILTLASFIQGWAIGGRLGSGGYLPFNLGSGPGPSATLGSFDASHPIMRGVTSATGDLLGQVSLSVGAQLVASWAGGMPFIATKGSHVVAVNFYYDYPGYWAGDLPLILHNSVLWAGGTVRFLSFEPASGELAPGASTDVQVRFDAARLFGGNYDSDVLVRSNDPVHPDLTLPAHLHVTGAPDIAVVPGSLDFGPVFLTASRPETLLITNQGTDLLTVSGINLSPADYSAPGGGFILEAGQSRPIVVTFAPLSATLLPGTLEIHSDDPDRSLVTVGLTGTGVPPPIIGVTPASVSADLLTGESVTRTLTVRNTGGSPLSFQTGISSVVQAGARPEAPGWRARLLASGPSGLSERSDRAPAGFRSSPVPATSSLAAQVLLIEDALPWSSDAVAWLLNHNGIAFDLIGSAALSSTLLAHYQLVIVPSDQPNSTYLNLAAASAQINAFVQSGGVLEFHAAGWGWNNGDASQVTLPGGMHISPHGASLNFVEDPAHPIMQGVPNPFSGNSASHAVFTNVPVGAHVLASDDAHEPDLVIYPFGSGLVISGCQTFEYGFQNGQGAGIILQNMIPYAYHQRRSWLAVDVTEGVIPPGGSTDVTVTLDAKSLNGGDYHADIQFLSNDPQRPLVAIPASLHVTGAPDIAVTPASLDFGNVYLTASQPETLLVTNQGTDLLTVSGVTVSPADYSVPGAAFTLSPGQSRALIVTFSPQSAAVVPGSIEVHSDDPDQPVVTVTMTGTGVPPPNIEATPASMSADLLTGQQSTQTLTIRNTGASDLDWQLDFAVPAAVRGVPATTLAGAGRSPSRGNSSAPGDFPSSTGNVVPSGYAPRLTPPSSMAGATALIIQDTAPWGLNANEVLLNANGIAFDMIGSAQLPTTDLLKYRLVIVAGDQATPFHAAIAARASQINEFVALGGVLEYHAAWGWMGGDVTLVTLPGGMHIHSNTSLNNAALTPGHPLLAGVPNPIRGNPASTSDFSEIPPGAIQIAANDAGHTDLVVYHFGAGVVVASGQLHEYSYAYAWDPGLILQNMIPYSHSLGMSWLKPDPRAGTIPAGGSAAVNVTFDAAHLFGGDYYLDLRLSSNDPDQPLVTIPTHLHVTGAPDIAVAPASLDFGPVYLTATRAESLLITNQGTDVLHVSGITITPADYAVPTSGFTLQPDQSQALIVTFSPQSAAQLPGTLEIHSDDPDEPLVTVPLSGQGVPPPIIGVSPTSLSFDVVTGAPATQPLTLSNTGNSPLTFHIGVVHSAATGAASATSTPMMRFGSAAAASATRFAAARDLLARGAGRTAAGDLLAKGTGRTAALAGARDPVPGVGARTLVTSSREPLSLAVKRPRQQSGGTVLVISDGGTESDVASVLTGAGYAVTLGPDDSAWNGTNPAPDGFAAVVLLDGVNYGSDMPLQGQQALLQYVANGGGLVLTEWVSFEVEGGRYTTLRDLMPTTRLTGDNGDFMYHVVQVHPVTAGVSTDFDVASGISVQTVNTGTALVTLPNGGSAVTIRDYLAGHVVQFCMAGNWAGFRPLLQPDMQRLLVNSVDWVGGSGWLSSEPMDGTIAAGSSQQLVITADPKGLLGGDYSLDLVVSSNDPAHPTLTVPANMHVTGAPDIAVAPASLDFGAIYLTTSRTESLLVRNQGTDLLTVSGISVSPGDYTVAGAGFTLPPGYLQVLTVTFSPQSAAAIPGILEIHSDDPDQPLVTVTLSGAGVTPPHLNASPPSLSSDLLSGQQETQTVTIGNTGGSDLDFVVATSMTALNQPALAAAPAKGQADTRRGHPVTTRAGGPDVFGYRWKDSDEPGGPAFNWVDITSVGTAIPFYGDDWNYGAIPIGFQFSYYGQKFDSLRVCSNGWISFTSFSGQFANQPLPSQNAPENLLAAFWADLYTNPGAVLYYNDGTRMIVEYRNVTYLGGGVPFTFEILLYPDGRMVYQYQGIGGNPSYASVGIQNGTRTDGLSISYNATYLHDNMAIEIAATPPWLTVSPGSGHVPAGGQVSLEVRFNAEHLNGGDYLGQLVIFNNDPADATHTIPANLHVTGVPNLTITPTALDFGPLFVGLSAPATVMLANLGSDATVVSSIDVVNPMFSVPAGPITLAPGASVPLTVTFTPSALGPQAGSLTLHSNDPVHGSQVVSLHGEGIEAPDLALQPGLVDALLGPDEIRTVNLRLDNRGGSPLVWSATALSISQAHLLADEPAGEGGHEWTPASAAAATAGLDRTLPAAVAGREVARALSAAGSTQVQVASPSLGDALIQLNDRYVNVTSAIPNRYDFTEGESGTSIADGGQNMYEYGNMLSTDLSGNIPYSNGVITFSPAFGAPYFTRKYPGLFVLVADVAGAHSFSISGQLGAAGAGVADGAVLTATVGGIFYFGFVKRVHDAGVPSVNHMIILASPGSVSHVFSSDTHQDQDLVSGLGSVTRFYYLLFAGNQGEFISNTDMASIMSRFIDALYPAPPWLSVAPGGGTVPPHDFTTLAVTLASHGITTGSHTGRIIVESNDPDAGSVQVPVTMSVLDVPTATDATLVSSSANGGRVQLVWYSAAGPGLTAAVSRGTRSGGWVDLAAIVPDGQGYLRYEDSDVVPGESYGYRLAITGADGVRFVGETWVTVPSGAEFALFGLQPNPAVHDLKVAFSLPDDQPATLELLDLSGRRVRFESVGWHGGGRHVVSLAGNGQLPSGVYLVRLERGGRRLVRKCVFIQ